MLYSHLTLDAHPLSSTGKQSAVQAIPPYISLLFRWLFAKIHDNASDRSLSLDQQAYLIKLKESDEEKFIEYLFRTYYASLCKSVNNIVRDTDAAEDIVQDVFIKVWRRREHLDLSRSIQSYLFRSCMNTALNYLEKYKKNTSMEEESIYTTAFSSNATQEELDAQEMHGRIQKAVNALPPKCKMVFSMSRYEEMSYADIAKTLDISQKAVEKHMSKALRILREHLKAFTNDTKSV